MPNLSQAGIRCWNACYGPKDSCAHMGGCPNYSLCWVPKLRGAVFRLEFLSGFERDHDFESYLYYGICLGLEVVP